MLCMPTNDIILCINVDWSIFWTAMTAVATFLLAGVGWRQLSALNNTNKEVFLNNLKEQFFTPKARGLIFLIEQEALGYEVKKFKLKDSENEVELDVFHNNLLVPIKDYLKEQGATVPQDIYTTNEVDDYLLQHLEDLGLYYKKGIINLDDADEAFGFYVTTIHDNGAIAEYIKGVQEDDPTIYTNFDFLYNRLPKPLKKEDGSTTH